MSWTVHRPDRSGTALHMTSHHPSLTHLLFMFQAILLAFEDLMRPARKQLATTQSAANRRKRPLDTQTRHMMLQLIGSDKLPTPPFTGNQPLRALVLLVDLLPVPPASNDCRNTTSDIHELRRLSDGHLDGVDATPRRRRREVEVRKSSETDAESARLLERHLLVGNFEPLLLPHPTPAPE